jgi:hypothetical protein
MKYPEIFDTENLELWFEKYLTKQVRSKEWDLMVTEELPDVFSIPFFTEEFCDKFVENIKDSQYHQSNRWGTPTNILSLDRLNLQDLSLNLITEFLYPISQHYWVINGKKWENMNIDPQILKFEPQQELRLHHDFCSITMSCVLDEYSQGGELVFEKYGTITPKQGHFYIFPGQITHRYGMRRIKNKNRYLFNIYGYAN